MLLRAKSRPIHSIAVILCTLLASAISASGKDDGNVVDRFKIYNDGDSLLVPVDIDGKSHSFVVDTGCTWTCFDRSLLSGDSIDNVEIAAFDKRISLRRFDTPAAYLRKHDLKTKLSSVVEFDLAPIRTHSGHNIMGILGMDFLKEFAMEIDFDRSELILRNELINRREMGSPIPIECNIDQQPVVLGQIHGCDQLVFTIDTGMVAGCSVSISKELCEDLLRTDRIHTVGQQLSLTAGGIGTRRILQGPAFTVGGNQLLRPMFGEETEGRQLGLYFLSRFHVILDFPNKRLFLRPGRAFEMSDFRDLSGLHVIKENNQVVVKSTDADSIAERSGIKASDLILQVDGQDVGELRLFTLRRLLGEDGRIVKLGIQRGKQPLEISLALKDLSK